MSTVNGNYYGGIVKDGLILLLDAAKIDSYPRTGTLWTDISRNGNNGTLTNGPSFSLDNGGNISCDGTNDFINFNTFGYSPGTTGNITLEMWVYPTGPYTVYTSEPPTTNLGCFFGQSYFNNSIGWGLGMATQSSVNYWIWQVRNLGTVVQPALTVSFTNNNWYHVVGTFTRNDFSRLYVNGTLSSSISSTPLNGISITPSLNDAKIGTGGILSFYAGHKMSVARIYNRALSASEVLQNYNALKGRYNI